MTALDKQALRQLATDAHELGIIKRYTKGIEANKRFAAIVTPLTVLALLDELEAAEKRIAELEARTVTLPTPYPKGYGLVSDKYNFALEECADAIRAAGIGVKGE
ncbi:ead/Ea22-like family protein [Citrobacter braakii]|uniref:ead/Ea22-like family protein n=1 Tax=Citrobacter braakii TaxID=57706 RepID=UPI00069CD0CE|nr:ead/Ea22-like family protein [Citrobacter braakii]EIV2907011.1 ead/Ea22-like family protein [Citrobacter braakii]